MATDSRTITTARLQPVPDLLPGVPSGQFAVIATLEDDGELTLFSYYTEELQFTAAEFEGQTVQQGLNLFARRHIEYLQS
jgi:hypothetical protein